MTKIGASSAYAQITAFHVNTAVNNALASVERTFKTVSHKQQNKSRISRGTAILPDEELSVNCGYIWKLKMM